MSAAPESRDVPHLALPQLGAVGLERLRRARVLLVGLGGLGGPVAQYLVAAGVGRLDLCDFDTVVASNLSRQVLYGPHDVGRPKVAVARERLAAQHPRVELAVFEARADAAFLARRCRAVDLVLDASDNFETRLAVNAACLASATPWIMGAAARLEGQLAVFRPADAHEPCYRCVYGEAPETLEDCAGGGVLGPLTGLLGSAMAVQALLLLAGAPTARGLLLLDVGQWHWRVLETRRRPHCPGCAAAARA